MVDPPCFTHLPLAAAGRLEHHVKGLLGAAGSVKGNADEEEHDGKHDDTDENVHCYSLPICSIRRSIWRCRRKMPRLSTTMPTMAKDNSVGVAVSAVEASHPTKLMSVMTIIPCQNLR